MTDIQNESETILRRDTIGRVHTPPHKREEILDAFERSGLSGPKFAELHGLNYQTFATWRRRRKAANEVSGDIAGPEASEFTFLEVEPPKGQQPLMSMPNSEALAVDLAGGHRLTVSSAGQAQLAAELINRLKS